MYPLYFSIYIQRHWKALLKSVIVASEMATMKSIVAIEMATMKSIVASEMATMTSIVASGDELRH